MRISNGDIKRIINIIEKQDKKISNIEKMLTNITKEPKFLKPKGKQQTENKYSGLTGAIFNLTKASFFNKPKELKEIRDQLNADAVFYPTTSYPDALLRLVKHKKLRRLQKNKKWKYVKYG